MDFGIVKNMSEFTVDFIGFIQSMDDKQLSYIASSDYGDQKDDYFKNLKKVIIHQSCIMFPEQQYMPGEVIDLCSTSLCSKHAAEFIACNLLLIINRGAFDNLDLGDRMKRQSYEYSNLSEPYEDLIKKAYRWAGF